MLKAATIILLTSTPTYAACHHYATWNYPYPQPSCLTSLAHRASEAKNWYVELQLEPPQSLIAEDQRTAAQIREFNEHNATITKYRDELNNQFEVLRLFRDYQRRLREQTGADTARTPEIVQPETEEKQ